MRENITKIYPIGRMQKMGEKCQMKKKVSQILENRDSDKARIRRKKAQRRTKYGKSTIIR